MLYIHEFPDWTSFRYNERKVLARLGRSRLEEGRLIGNLAAFDAKGACRDILAKDIVANFAIDGRTLKFEKVREEVDLALSGKSSDNAIKNLIGATRNAQNPISEERLFAWHSSLAANRISHYREDEGEISFVLNGNTLKFRGTSFYRTQKELLKFINWFNADNSDALLKAAIAQFHFLAIRPFHEANGRIARALSGMALAKGENISYPAYSLCGQIFKHRTEYFEILNRIERSSGEITDWILWFFDIFDKAVEESVNAIQLHLRAAKFRAEHAGTSLNEREQKLVSLLLNSEFTDKLTSSRLATLMNTSPDTALRDIQDMIEKGVLQKEDRGGRSTSYRLADLG